jgi:GNAT superfamily N-acetyltransferase
MRGSIAAVVVETVLRTLRQHEREDLLTLLEAWPAPSGWRGSPGDFFRRYVELDPSFADENVWVAAQGADLVACVQIFPRLLRVRDAAVPTGGIGTVFTTPDARKGGIASALLGRAIAAMRSRGMELSLLFSQRHSFYERLGWSLWPRERRLWLRSEATRAPEAPGERFDRARDLDDVFALHTAHSARCAGSVVRDLAFFHAQLGFAGNPDEEFLLARDAQGTLLAFVRGAVLGGFYLVTEFARRAEPAAAQALADLVLSLMQPSADDPFALEDRPSGELRRVFVAPSADDAGLDAALAHRGVEVRGFPGRDVMLQVLDADALARRLREPRAAAESGTDFLRRVLPPQRFAFWPADRF